MDPLCRGHHCSTVKIRINITGWSIWARNMLFVDIILKVPPLYELCILGGAATCSEGFVICFIKVPLAYLNSMAAAVYPNSLWNSQKNKHKTLGTSGRPTQYKSATLIAMSIKSCPRPDGPPCSSSITNE